MQNDLSVRVIYKGGDSKYMVTAFCHRMNVLIDFFEPASESKFPMETGYIIFICIYFYLYIYFLYRKEKLKI